MKNKIIYILLLVILFVFILSSYSFASTSFPNVAVDEYSNYFIFKYNASNIFLVTVSDTSFVVGHSHEENGYICFYTQDISYNSYRLEGNSWVACNLGDYSLLEGRKIVASNRSNLEMLNSSFNILYDTYWQTLTGKEYFYEASTVPLFKTPYIVNTANDLSAAKYDSVIINPGTLSLNDKFNFIVRKCNSVNLDEGVYESQNVVFNTVLDFSSPYYKDTGSFVVSEFWYEIPRNSLGIAFNNGDKYIYSLEKDGEVLQDIVTTVGGLTEEDKELNRFDTIKDAINQGNKETANAIKDTTNAIKEQTEVSKNIFQKIGDILSFINPFSENFFGRKLVELILDGLKSLFVPSDDFFTNWFDDMNSWLGDRFGILYFPTEIVLDFLNRVGGLSSSSSCSLTIPQLKINFFGNEVVVFNGYTYDFNELLVNDTFKNIHTIYLTVVDVILYLCLIVLAHNAFSTVFGGHYIDDAVHDTYDYVEFKQTNSKKIKPGFNTGGRR